LFTVEDHKVTSLKVMLCPAWVLTTPQLSYEFGPCDAEWGVSEWFKPTLFYKAGLRFHLFL